MLTSIQSAGVAPEVNLRITQVRKHARDLLPLGNTGQTLPEVQNRGINGPMKRTFVLQNLKKNKKKLSKVTLLETPYGAPPKIQNFRNLRKKSTKNNPTGNKTAKNFNSGYIGRLSKFFQYSDSAINNRDISRTVALKSVRISVDRTNKPLWFLYDKQTSPPKVIRISRSEEFHFGGSSGGEMQHFMQFSVATFLMKCSIQCEGI